MADLKIFGEHLIDGKTVDQMHKAMKAPGVLQGALMPDAHLGYTMPIGGVIKTEDVVYPSWVGYDIGCGVCYIETSFNKDDVQANSVEIFNRIKQLVPLGPTRHDVPITYMPNILYTDVICEYKKSRSVSQQMGTLGANNHFIEVGFNRANKICIVIHSGSRNLGHHVATQYMSLACYLETGVCKAREGNYGLSVSKHPDRLNAYITDYTYCVYMALLNRKVMLNIVERAMHDVLGDTAGQVRMTSLINKVHNSVTITKDHCFIHRKGATDATKGTRGVVPGGPSVGSFVVRGLGNPDSLDSSSHGSGRAMSPTKAKQKYDTADHRIAMQGITCDTGGKHLREIPLSYKDGGAVMDAQTDLVEVVDHVRPILVVKG